MLDATFHPGQIVPSTGLYRVYHYQHRLPHDAVIRHGEVFPTCNRCGDRVTFHLATAAEPLRQDPDFELKQAS